MDVSYTSDLRERFYLLGQSYPGFEEVLNQALFALLTREHILWYSKPGRAKSAVAKGIFGIFDATIFTKTLTMDMLPEQLLGNIIPDELIKHGKEIYNIQGGLADSVFAFLDEFFDASDFVLRGALLNVLNEREFHAKDMPTIKAPLHTAITATNYLREREATEAVLDRILCKAVLEGVTSITDSMRAGMTYLGLHKHPSNLPPLPYLPLLELADTVERPEYAGGIAMSAGMRLLHVMLLQEFQQRRIELALERWQQQPENQDTPETPDATALGINEITPRTMVKLHDFSRAAAVLNGRSQVNAADQRALAYGLVTVGAPNGEMLLWHTLCDEYLQLNRGQQEALEQLGRLSDLVGQIKAERSMSPATTFQIGGQLVVQSKADIMRLVHKLTARNHPVVLMASQTLQQEIRDMDIDTHTFDLRKGW